MMLDETFTLANGVRIPKLGLGTGRIADGDVADIVRQAIDIGYRTPGLEIAFEEVLAFPKA